MLSALRMCGTDEFEIEPFFRDFHSDQNSDKTCSCADEDSGQNIGWIMDHKIDPGDRHKEGKNICRPADSPVAG